MCKCSICGKEFEYGDEHSPMLKNEIWAKILEFYNLTEQEKQQEVAEVIICEIENISRSDRIKDLLDTLYSLDILHTFICTDCMEKALGRKLTKDDLIEGHVPFNEAFEKTYFKP